VCVSHPSGHGVIYTSSLSSRRIQTKPVSSSLLSILSGKLFKNIRWSTHLAKNVRQNYGSSLFKAKNNKSPLILSHNGQIHNKTPKINIENFLRSNLLSFSPLFRHFTFKFYGSSSFAACELMLKNLKI
jgi:hypothetical protein